MKLRLVIAIVAALTASLLAPLAAGAQDTILQPRNQTIYFGAGCPPANPAGSCASTEYFLSRQPGESNIGNLVTAVSWAQRKAGSGYLTDTYAGDSTLNDTYILQGGDGIALAGQIVVGGWAGVEYAADSGVSVRVYAHVAGEPGFETVNLCEAEITKQVVAPGDTEYAFSCDIPAEMDGIAIDSLDAEVGHDSLTVLGNGFVDGSGASFMRLKYYEEIPA